MKKILIFNQNYIGDVVFTLPTLRSLREGYPDSYIEVVMGRNPIEVVKGNPYIDSLVIRSAKLSEKIALLRKIRETNYDICLSFSSRSLEIAIFAFLSGCRRRFGFFNPSTIFFYNFHIRENLEDHSALDYLKLAVAAGGKEVQLIPQIFLQEEELQKAKETLKALDIKEGEKIFAILLGGSTPFKRWHLPTLRNLLKEIKDGGKILLFGGKEFQSYGEALEKELPNVYNLSGKSSLRESMALLKFSSLFIGQDSGLTHIAAALGVPTIGLYGATDPKRTAPLGKYVRVIFKPPPCGPCWGKKKCIKPICTEMITVKEIEREAEILLKEVYGL